MTGMTGHYRTDERAPLTRLTAEHRLGAPAPQHVAVLRALQMGDLLCAVPALRALRQALPEAAITLVGLPWARGFVQRYSHYVDHFLEFPGGAGLPERRPRPGALSLFLRQARKERFDLAIQLHGSGEQSNALVADMQAQRCAGFFRPGTLCPDAERFLPYPEQGPEVRRLLRLMEFLGIPLRGEHLEFPLSESEQEQTELLLKQLGLQRTHYVCLHPGARAAARRWPVQRFAAVADALAWRGLRVVLTGSEAERGLTDAIAEQMSYSALNLAGKTSLGTLAGLLSGARLLVCNDTGVSHIAAALRLPSVVVYLASSPERWAPLDAQRHRRLFREVDCRPCNHAQCPIGHPCAQVPAEQVLAQALRLLSRARS